MTAEGLSGTFCNGFLKQDAFSHLALCLGSNQCFIAAFFKEAHKLHITRSRPIKMSGAEHKSFVNISLMLDDHQKADISVKVWVGELQRAGEAERGCQSIQDWAIRGIICLSPSHHPGILSIHARYHPPLTLRWPHPPLKAPDKRSAIAFIWTLVVKCLGLP